jgi:hypothetical protein
VIEGTDELTLPALPGHFEQLVPLAEEVGPQRRISRLHAGRRV